MGERAQRGCRRRAKGLAAAAAFAAACALVPASARAHPEIDRARRHYHDAQFAEALAALGAAERSERLSRRELHDLLALRATVHFATRADDALRESLATLASVAPRYRFDPDLPPPFLEAWARARERAEPVAIRVSVIERGRRLRFATEVVGPAASLARGAPRVYARERGGAWRLVGHRAFAAANPVEFYVEALGPGAVVIARVGSAESPRVTGRREAEGWLPSSRELPWYIAGAATIVAVVLAVALAVVSAEP